MSEFEKLNGMILDDEMMSPGGFTDEHIDAIDKEHDKHYEQSLRDQFAMAALTGILASQGENIGVFSSEPKVAAREAYEFASEMMEARK